MCNHLRISCFPFPFPLGKCLFLSSSRPLTSPSPWASRRGCRQNSASEITTNILLRRRFSPLLSSCSVLLIDQFPPKTKHQKQSRRHPPGGSKHVSHHKTTVRLLVFLKFARRHSIFFFFFFSPQFFSFSLSLFVPSCSPPFSNASTLRRHQRSLYPIFPSQDTHTHALFKPQESVRDRHPTLPGRTSLCR